MSLVVPRKVTTRQRCIARARAELDLGLAARLQRMVGFRNLAVHRYRELDIAIVQAVIRDGLDDLLAFAERLRQQLDDGEKT